MNSFSCTVTETHTVTASYTVTSASTANYHFVNLGGAPPDEASISRPPLRAGAFVRVTTPGVLRDRVGRVVGVFLVRDQRVVFVEWPEGGTAILSDEDVVLDPAGGRRETMQVTTRRDLRGPDGETLPAGTVLSAVESNLYYTVGLGDGTKVRVQAVDLRVACEAPECGRQASYDSPGNWCSVHWQQWWDWPKKKQVPSWMSVPASRLASFPTVTLLRDLEVDGHTLAKGCEVQRQQAHLLVRVRAEGGTLFAVDRTDLAIKCEAQECEREAELWHPCYCCKEHYYAWLDDDLLLPGIEKNPPDEAERPAWQQGPGAGRPSDYPSLSAREQWDVDKRLGILDDEW